MALFQARNPHLDHGLLSDHGLRRLQRTMDVQGLPYKQALQGLLAQDRARNEYDRGPGPLSGMHPLDKAAIATSPIPGVGDVVGAAADARAIYNDPSLTNIGFGLAGLLPFVPARAVTSAAAKLKQPVQTGQKTLYHGSPHRWTPEAGRPAGRPDLSHMGSGEGAQAYGHGMYFAEEPNVAKNYAQRDFDYEDRLMELYNDAERAQDYDAMEVYENAMLHDTPSEIARKMGDRAKDAQKKVKKLSESSKTNLYQLGIPEEETAKMLDWDAPLSEQPKSVRDGVEKTIRKMEETDDVGGSIARGIAKDDGTGGAIIQAIAAGSGEAENVAAKTFASDMLRDNGILGIKYLDQMSRGTGGTRNYVVWDQDLLNRANIGSRNESTLGGLLDDPIVRGGKR